MRRLHIMCGALLVFLSCGSVALAADNQEIWKGLFGYQQKMANLGNAEAQFKLAEMYEQGSGVAADRAQARHWYQQAAAQGYPPAQQRLAQLDAAAATDNAPASASVEPAPVPAAPAPAPAAAPAAATSGELVQLQHERERLQQELAQSREAMKRMQEQQAQLAHKQDDELRRAEAEKAEALRRLAAQQRLDEARKQMQATPSAFDN